VTVALTLRKAVEPLDPKHLSVNEYPPAAENNSERPIADVPCSPVQLVAAGPELAATHTSVGELDHVTDTTCPTLAVAQPEQLKLAVGGAVDAPIGHAPWPFTAQGIVTTRLLSSTGAVVSGITIGGFALVRVSVR